MRGIPNKLNSKQDIETCVALAIAGDLDKVELKERLQNLLSDEKVYVFSKVVDQAYTATASEKVIESENDGVVTYDCFILTDNPASRFLKLGITKTELNAHIKKL